MSLETKIVADTTVKPASVLHERWLQTVDWWSLFRLTRLHKFPVGSDVTATPCLWGVLMAAHNVNYHSVGPIVRLLALWSFAQTMVHSAGCVVNDIADRDIDALVERSKNRPLPSGSVTLNQAILLTAVLHAIIIGTLSFCGLPIVCIGVLQIVVFAWSYPLMKRWTYWPQAWLGITFGWGILEGWLSVSGDTYNTFAIGTLWVGNICWTIMYDTIYACQDREDDVTAGIKSTAVLFGNKVRMILSLFAVGFLVCLTITGVLNGQGPWYFVISVGGAVAHVTWQLYTLDCNDKQDCDRKFRSNGVLGYIVSLGLLCDWLF